MKQLRERALCLFLLLLGGGCSPEVQVTQIVATIYADESVASDLTRIEVETFESLSGGGTTLPAAGGHRTFNLGSAHDDVALPFSFGIQKRTSEQFLLVIKGYSGATLSIEQKALVRFENGQVRGLRLYLSQACFGKMCADEASEDWFRTTCRADREPLCGDVFEQATEFAKPGTELRDQDAGPEMEAGAIGPGRTEPGPDAGPPTLDGGRVAEASTDADSLDDVAVGTSETEPKDAAADDSSRSEAGAVDAALRDAESDAGTSGCGATCPMNASCNADMGLCTCNSGFELRAGSCANIDDCRTNPCGAGHTCVDAVNDYSCTCAATHFQASSKRCVPRFSAITTGDRHTCALRTDGSTVCWGDNSNYQLGQASPTVSAPTPVEVAGLANVVRLAAGSMHTCALDKDGAVWCWGLNRGGQLGNGNAVSTGTPMRVVDLSAVSGIAAGTQHNCAAVASGGIACWGDNVSGQIGDGTMTRTLRPLVVAGISGVVIPAAGSIDSCVRRSDNTVSCWGSNFEGEFCNGMTSMTATTPTAFGLTGVAEIALGVRHTCVRRTSGAITCCGDNSSGVLGDGTHTSTATGTTVSGLSSVTKLALGTVHSCALRSDGSAACWGANDEGVLGDGNLGTASATPVTVRLSGVTDIAAGVSHTCAIRNDGTAHCWGSNRYGQLGNGAMINSGTPVQVTAY